ncbi:hypothetical protein JHK82_029881 [Glycine max]|nr:hypothetical protein JHK86_029963 [Glycine max]KAG5123144.1 hypothetical protein JHK82_029881 [Glycine max]KAG5144558.1 hypothetical protein JHK84_030101 [Glycine max]KHN35006.1 hypothetical protein glysoja_004772 [Glycine soja]
MKIANIAQVSKETILEFSILLLVQFEKSNEHPEWLPDDWNVDFRTRKSGANMGHGQSKGPLAKCSILRLFMAGTSQGHPQICIEYCYIAPSGHKFYSKPEVLRYLDTVNINSNSHTSKKEKICKSNDTVEKSTIEDLPPGQIKEVKIRKGSNDNRDVVEKSPVEDLPPGWITEAKVRKGDTGNRKDMV